MAATGTLFTAVGVEEKKKKKEEGLPTIQKTVIPPSKTKEEIEKNELSRKKRVAGIDIVEKYFVDNDGFNQVVVERPQVQTIDKGKKSLSATQSKFMDFSKKSIGSRIDDLYASSKILQEYNVPEKRKHAEDEAARQKRIKETNKKRREAMEDQRVKVNYKLKELEKQRTFATEIEAKEHALSVLRDKHDQLIYQRDILLKKKVQDKDHLSQLDNQKAMLLKEEELQDLRCDIDEIQSRWVVYDLEKDQLKHMSDAYKADILALQEKLMNKKAQLREGRLRLEKVEKLTINTQNEINRQKLKLVCICD